MSIIIRRVYAPFVSRLLVVMETNAVCHGVAHIRIIVLHVYLHSQCERRLRPKTHFHFTEKAKRLFRWSVTARWVGSSLAIIGNLLRCLIIYIAVPLLNKILGDIVKTLEIIRRVSNHKWLMP